MRPLQGMAVLLVVVLLLRSTALTALAARGVVVDVLAFATVVWSLRHGAAWGTSFGFALGIAADIDAVHWLGRHALALSLLGYGAGRLAGTLVRDSVRTQLVLLLVATVLHQSWTVAFEVGSVEGWRYLLERIVVAALVTPPLGVLLLFALRHLSGQPLFHATVPSRTSP